MNKKQTGKNLFLLVKALFTMTITNSFAQNVEKPTVEIFTGAELHYRDIYYTRMYDVLMNITPGVKWHIGNQWMLSGQALVPIYNDYGGRYKKIRLDMAVLSKEWNWSNKHFFKMSGGMFGMERYGLDLKWMYPVNRWLAFDAQVGVTGFCSMAVDWECSKMNRVSGWAGAKLYIEKADTELRLKAGRFMYKDYGIIGEAMRHFKHCTVGVYAQYSDEFKENGGFKIVMMIPPYHRKTSKVTIRPASNFRFTYNIQAQPYAVKMYTTDPEENEREGYFDNKSLDWGSACLRIETREGGEK